MSNVYGALDSTVLDVTVDPYAIATSAVTQLSFSSLESPQNQTRDITKILKKKLPVATGNDELVFPFDSALFTAPLNYVAETSLPISLGQTVTKAVGVQWSFLSAKPISAGCITVLGDTKLLQDEATTDPKASTYTINQIMPDAVVAEATYFVNVVRYIPGQTQQRNFTWLSLDTPTMVVAKWKATMSPAVAYAGFTQSFGHAALSFDSTTGDIEITRNTEWSSSIAFYHQIYKPVIRICGELMSSKEVVNIVSCTATDDSWLITTDHQYNAIQVVATPAYNPTSITALNKASPVFLSATSITSSDDWQVKQLYVLGVSGAGLHFSGSRKPTRYTGAGAPLQWNISGSNKISIFAVIETFQFNLWQVNQIEEFFMSVAHIPYKYWRITITLIETAGAAIHTTISDISFISGWSVGMTSLLSA
ncbi:hypothetical protein T492DRAFT_841486 [Pavlovales sp. CCMP2436]|nr:hypothetical protein T492DRAFT_841486 [Pavlovales sp. CCMP2436]